MHRRISKRVAAEIRLGFQLADELHAMHGPNTHAAVMFLTAKLFNSENTGPFIRAARRRYARLVLRGRSAD